MSVTKRSSLLCAEHRFVASVIGGSLIMTTLGTNYCLGGLAPYIVSRLHVRRANATTDSPAAAAEMLHTGSIVWVFVAAALFQGLGMLASGFLVTRLPCDRRWSILGGCLLSSLGTCLSGLAIDVSLGLVILTSGAIFGFGQGIAYALVIESVTSWTKVRKGLVTGILVSSFAAGTFIYLPIQSKIINPDNLTPDWRVASDRLFSQPEVTSRTPRSFFVMSSVYAVVQVACVFLVRRRRRRSEGDADDEGEGDSGETGEATLLIAAGVGTTPTSQPPPPTSADAAAATVDAGAAGSEAWTLRQAMTSLPFLVMGVSIFFMTPASIVLPSLDKAYGETFISNDMLLSVLAGIAGVFNAVGRLVAGAVIDRVHFRVCVFAQGLLLAALHAATPLSVYTHPALYFSLVCLVNFVFAGMFVFFPYAVEDLFGSGLFPQVYGLVYFFKAVSGALIAVVTTTCLGQLGWSGVMLLTAAASGIGGLIIILYNTDRWRLGVSLC